MNDDDNLNEIRIRLRNGSCSIAADGQHNSTLVFHARATQADITREGPEAAQEIASSEAHNFYTETVRLLTREHRSFLPKNVKITPYDGQNEFSLPVTQAFVDAFQKGTSAVQTAAPVERAVPAVPQQPIAPVVEQKPVPLVDEKPVQAAAARKLPTRKTEFPFGPATYFAQRPPKRTFEFTDPECLKIITEQAVCTRSSSGSILYFTDFKTAKSLYQALKTSNGNPHSEHDIAYTASDGSRQTTSLFSFPISKMFLEHMPAEYKDRFVQERCIDVSMKNPKRYAEVAQKFVKPGEKLPETVAKEHRHHHGGGRVGGGGNH